MPEERCANCRHPVKAHNRDGCFVGSALEDFSQHCTCPFEYDGESFNAWPRRCPGYYKITSGSIVWCDRPVSHPGDHEGYYPGDAHRSHWKDKPVLMQAAPDEPRCNSHHRDAPGDQRCIRPAEHPAEHRTGVSLTGLCWYDDADGAYVPVANPDRVKAADAQVGGSHYTKFKIQPWAVIDEYALDYYRGNVVKYILRAGHKGSKLEDLKKARHYLDRAIEIEEGK